jgi:hypothetical protein
LTEASEGEKASKQASKPRRATTNQLINQVPNK